jgi:hypothetical protein
MRAFEWETKGVSRTLDPSTAAMRAWPFSKPDNRLDREAGTRTSGADAEKEKSGLTAKLKPSGT